MREFVLDFETYYDDGYSIGDEVIDYILDPRFEILAIGLMDVADGKMSIAIGPTEVKRALAGIAKMPERRVRIIAHNARFDASILRLRTSVPFGVYYHTFDLLGLARMVYPRVGNSLRALAVRLGLPPKGDTPAFKGMRWWDSLYPPPPALVEKMREYLARDLELERSIYLKLKNQGNEYETFLNEHSMRLWLDSKLRFDDKKAVELQAAMNEKLAEKLPPGVDSSIFHSDDLFKVALAKALKAAGDDIVNYVKKGKNGQTLLAIAKTDKQRTLLETHNSEEVRKLIHANNAVSSWPLHIKRIEKMKKMAQAFDGQYPIAVNYWGSHTGRWTGGENSNPLNFGARGDPLISQTRNLLVAPPEHSLIIADYKTVEPRGLFWLAGEWTALEELANGDLYLETCSVFAGRKIVHPDTPGLTADQKADAAYWRGAGKVAVLGAGYKAAGEALFKQGGGKYDLGMCEKMVASYRARFPGVPRLWAGLERAFELSFRYGRTEIHAGCKFTRPEPGRMFVELMNGHLLRYTVRHSERGLQTHNQFDKRQWVPFHGGVLTENIVQAFCRDLLTDALRRLEDVGISIVHHCYDELSACVPDENIEASKASMERIMCNPPAWAKRLPVGVEIKVSRCYTK